jgi:hypothetical protein
MQFSAEAAFLELALEGMARQEQRRAQVAARKQLKSIAERPS